MNFTIPATSKRIITIVVATLAIVALITIGTLSYCLIFGVHSDPTLLTAYVGIATGSLAGITGLLANTRTTPGTDADMPKATMVQDGVTAKEQPQEVKVVSTVKDPVHTEEAPKVNLATEPKVP
jgi:hypothetical protein